MGYECKFSYHEKVDNEYNRDEVKTFSRKVGDPLEDVPLEKLAAAIMGQYARRDIFIVGVDVFEISKKAISFKETKGGIVLKNKKFLFDHGGDATVVAVEEERPQLQLASPPAPHQMSLSAAAHAPQQMVNVAPQSQRRPVDFVLFAPEPQQLFAARKLGLKFTENKKYPVFEKKMSKSGIGEVFLVTDDLGQDQSVSDIYFVPANVNLFADRELNFSESTKEREGGKLFWGNASVDPNIPELRPRR